MTDAIMAIEELSDEDRDWGQAEEIQPLVDAALEFNAALRRRREAGEGAGPAYFDDICQAQAALFRELRNFVDARIDTLLLRRS